MSSQHIHRVCTSSSLLIISVSLSCVKALPYRNDKLSEVLELRFFSFKYNFDVAAFSFVREGRVTEKGEINLISNLLDSVYQISTSVTWGLYKFKSICML